MMGIDDIFIGFLISYIAGSLPSLKDVFFKKSKRSMKELVENCYNEALKKWMADSAVRESIAQQEPVKSGKLQDLCLSFVLLQVFELRELYIDNINCYQKQKIRSQIFPKEY